jgi:hypothetical protein
VLKLSTVRHRSEQIFLGDRFVIQTWIHTTGIQNGSPAQREMRFSGGLSIGLCADFDNPSYQPKLGGLDRTEKKI